jgi:hypothetical protein
VAFHSTFRGVPVLTSMVDDDISGPGREVVNRTPEEAGSDERALAKVAGLLEDGGDAVVMTRSEAGRIRVLNLTRDGAEVSIVDLLAGTLTVVRTAEVEAEGAGLGQVYALVYDAGGQWVPVHPLGTSANSDAGSEAGETEAGETEAGETGVGDLVSDAVSEVTDLDEADDRYDKLEREQGDRDGALREALARKRDVPVPGTNGWLRQTFSAMLWLGALGSAALIAELAAASRRDIIALAFGPQAQDDPRLWRFRPSGRPLPVRIEDLPPDAQAAFAELTGKDRS